MCPRIIYKIILRTNVRSIFCSSVIAFCVVSNPVFKKGEDWVLCQHEGEHDITNVLVLNIVTGSPSMILNIAVFLSCAGPSSVSACSSVNTFWNMFVFGFMKQCFLFCETLFLFCSVTAFCVVSNPVPKAWSSQVLTFREEWNIWCFVKHFSVLSNCYVLWNIFVRCVKYLSVVWNTCMFCGTLFCGVENWYVLWNTFLFCGKLLCFVENFHVLLNYFMFCETRFCFMQHVSVLWTLCIGETRICFGEQRFCVVEICFVVLVLFCELLFCYVNNCYVEWNTFLLRETRVCCVKYCFCVVKHDFCCVKHVRRFCETLFLVVWNMCLCCETLVSVSRHTFFYVVNRVCVCFVKYFVCFVKHVVCVVKHVVCFVKHFVFCDALCLFCGTRCMCCETLRLFCETLCLCCETFCLFCETHLSVLWNMCLCCVKQLFPGCETLVVRCCETLFLCCETLFLCCETFFSVLWNTCSVVWSTCSVLWNTGSVLWNTCSVLWNTCSVLWNTFSVLWNTYSVLWNTCSVLWHTLSVLWNTCFVLWSTVLCNTFLFCETLFRETRVSVAWSTGSCFVKRVLRVLCDTFLFREARFCERLCFVTHFCQSHGTLFSVLWHLVLFCETLFRCANHVSVIRNTVPFFKTRFCVSTHVSGVRRTFLFCEALFSFAKHPSDLRLFVLCEPLCLCCETCVCVVKLCVVLWNMFLCCETCFCCVKHVLFLFCETVRGTPSVCEFCESYCFKLFGVVRAPQPRSLQTSESIAGKYRSLFRSHRPESTVQRSPFRDHFVEASCLCYLVWSFCGFLGWGLCGFCCEVPVAVQKSPVRIHCSELAVSQTCCGAFVLWLSCVKFLWILSAEKYRSLFRSHRSESTVQSSLFSDHFVEVLRASVITLLSGPVRSHSLRASLVTLLRATLITLLQATLTTPHRAI